MASWRTLESIARASWCNRGLFCSAGAAIDFVDFIHQGLLRLHHGRAAHIPLSRCIARLLRMKDSDPFAVEVTDRRDAEHIGEGAVSLELHPCPLFQHGFEVTRHRFRCLRRQLRVWLDLVRISNRHVRVSCAIDTARQTTTPTRRVRCIVRVYRKCDSMSEQQILDYFARLAKPRLTELLRLKAQHVFDDTPGDADSTSMAGSSPVRLKLARSIQPYASIERFATEEKAMGFVVNPGLVPLVKAIAVDVRGRQWLITRRIARSDRDEGTVAHVEGYGVRILMQWDPEEGETRITWECLYGVA